MANSGEYLVQATYNEAFQLPIIDELSAEKIVLLNLLEIRNRTSLDSINIRVNVINHPGYQMDIVENHIVARTTKTEFQGMITLHPAYQLIGNPLSTRQNGMNDSDHFFLPFGVPNLRSKIRY